MAGFDFTYSFTERQRPYVEACNRAGKSRAHRLTCRWRIRKDSQYQSTCVVDGNTYKLDLLCRALEADIPIVCEGVKGDLSPSRANALGRGFVDAVLRGREYSQEEGIVPLRECKQVTLYFPPFALAARLSNPLLEARLRITEDIVADFGLGRTERVVVLEELHTALEQTLRELLGARRRENWPSLVRQAADHGYLRGVSNCQHQPDEHHTDEQLLLEGINRRRNDAKHNGADPNDQWIASHWICIGSLLERLVGRLQVSSAKA